MSGAAGASEGGDVSEGVAMGADISVKDTRVAGVRVRVYEPRAEQATGRSAEAATGRSAEPWAALVWAHGGSFVRGNLDWPEADWAARRFAEAGMRVFSVDYVLASETVKAPAPAEDVAAVLAAVLAGHANGDEHARGAEHAARAETPVFTGGASAGAHLAVAAALEVETRPRGLALVYPTLHRTQREDAAISRLTAALPEVRQFSAQRIAEMYDFYLGSGSDSKVRPVGELPPEQLKGLPPTVMVNADADDLRASGEQFAEQLRAAGVSVETHTQPGTMHGYLNRPDESPSAQRDARATIDFTVRALGAILGHNEPTQTQRSRAMEREIEGPVSLILPDGRLNPDAVGWATQPLVDTTGIARGKGRNKRWEY